MRTTPEWVSIYGSRFRLISPPRFIFVQDFLTFRHNLLPASLSRRIRVPHLPASKNISSRHQQMYMDVHLLMRYLPALFSSASVFKMTTKPLSSYDAFAYQNRHGCCWFHPAVSFVNLQHPCCTLTCEFCKRNAFAKRRYRPAHPPSMAVLRKLTPWLVHGCTSQGSG